MTQENGKKPVHILITTLGKDRPGIVEDLSRWILEAGGNIEDSRMSLLGGDFATLILARGEAAFEGDILESLTGFQEENGLTIFVRRVESGPPENGSPLLRYRLQGHSLDHPGIVYRVSQMLRGRGINIVSAQTETGPAPFSGAPAFFLDMHIDIPSGVPIGPLRDTLREIGDRENIDFELSPLR